MIFTVTKNTNKNKMADLSKETCLKGDRNILNAESFLLRRREVGWERIVLLSFEEFSKMKE